MKNCNHDKSNGNTKIKNINSNGNTKIKNIKTEGNTKIKNNKSWVIRLIYLCFIIGQLAKALFAYSTQKYASIYPTRTKVN